MHTFQSLHHANLVTDPFATDAATSKGLANLPDLNRLLDTAVPVIHLQIDVSDVQDPRNDDYAAKLSISERARPLRPPKVM